jgi:hypothetical protein
MYAIARNTWKYKDRDKRMEKIQTIEYDFLAPDTINEMFTALTLLEKLIGKAYLKNEELITEESNEAFFIITGKSLLEANNPCLEELEVVATGIENTKRKTLIVKAAKAYNLYKELITYYGYSQLIQFIQSHSFKSLKDAIHILPAKLKRKEWINVGGQLILKDDIEKFKSNVKKGNIIGWDAVHQWYAENGTEYNENKLKHALASLVEIKGINLNEIDGETLAEIIHETITTKEWITNKIYESRAKDYKNPFRSMVYDNEMEMEMVVGKIEDNTFINDQIKELDKFKNDMQSLLSRYCTNLAMQ